jgi:lysophospholipid acyltransferase (LPLAT)-like uncharacterized protein
VSLKSLLRSARGRRVLSTLGAAYIRLVHATGRWTSFRASYTKGVDDGGPFIFCFWHARLLMMPYCWSPKRRAYVLISNHADGRLISETIARFGFGTVFGSTSKGGTQALRDMLKLLKSDESVAITPDGPRGPRMRAQPGAIAVARMSGIPLVPCSYSTSRRRLLRSWDRFVLPLPFGRGVFLWGEPIHVPRDADEAAQEEARRRLEDSLNALSLQADRLCGQEPVMPAPEAA